MDYFKEGVIRHASTVSVEERHQMIKEHLFDGVSKLHVWRKYTGQKKERGGLLRWMRMYGYVNQRKPIFIPRQYHHTIMAESGKNLSNEQLQAKIKELERQLEDAKLQKEGYLRMIEIAEKELNIHIRKKLDTNGVAQRR